MAKPDGRIEKGQRLSTAISARAWNRAQDAADIVLGVRPGFSVPSGLGTGPQVVIDGSWSGPALNQYEVVSVSIAYQASSQRKLEMWATVGYPNPNQLLGILQEPVAAGTFMPCRVLIAGVTPVRVTSIPTMTHTSNSFCGVRNFNPLNGTSLTNIQKCFSLSLTPIGPARLIGTTAFASWPLTLDGDIERDDPVAAQTGWRLVLL